MNKLAQELEIIKSFIIQCQDKLIKITRTTDLVGLL